jgi:hypothetical protein
VAVKTARLQEYQNLNSGSRRAKGLECIYELNKVLEIKVLELPKLFFLASGEANVDV